MKPEDAAKILNLSGKVSKKDIKHAYRLASAKFHPDRNPGGTEGVNLIWTVN